MKIRIKGGGAFDGREGETLLSGLAAAGVVLSAPCGGRGVCGKCRVRILEGDVRGAVPGPDGTVCSCRAVPVSGLTVELINDEAVWENEVGRTGLPKAGGPPVTRAGVALDVGTTTVSARLVDMERGRILDSCSLLNDQRGFGADVMSRIDCARRGKTEELHRLIIRETGNIIENFTTKFDLERVETLAVSGNTAMLHFFAGEDPSGLGEAPFTPAFLEERYIPGSSLGLPAGEVKLLPSASAFFGADIVAGLAVIDILNSKEPVLLLDIGTNGEIGLFHRDRLFCCSTAAGPAFEGAEISCGIGGIRGAINRISGGRGNLSFQTIGNAPPAGICGCGLIDGVALMLREGIVDETGAFCGEGEKFTLTGGISITGRDIRQYQLAKSAIQSGIRILCQRAALEAADIGAAFIAGGLGFFIDIQNALDTGVLPRELGGKIYVCGNSSLQGAVLALLDGGFIEKCKKIAGRCEIIDLASDPRFMDIFAENMFFPEKAE